MIFNETLTCHLVEIVISFCDTCTSDIKLAHDTYRQFVAVLVDDELTNIELRTTYGHDLSVGEFSIIRSYRNFSRTITIEYAGFRDVFKLF